MAVLIDMDFNDAPGSGTATDSAGTTAYNGTMQNGATTDGAGNLVLDGVNDFVEIAPAPELGLTQGTIVLEVTPLSNATEQALFSVDSQGYDGGGHLAIMRFTNGMIGVRHQTTTEEQFYAGGMTNLGEISTIAYSWGPSGSTLSVNGSVVALDTVPLTFAGDVEPLVIGGSQAWSGDGVADDVRDEFQGEVSRFTLYDEPMGPGGTIPCFAADTGITTPEGEVRADSLRPGDLVTTRDHGVQPLRDVLKTSVSTTEMAIWPHLRPILIPSGRLGAVRDLLVTRQHGVFFDGPESPRFVRAGQLARHYKRGVRVANGVRSLTYVHLLTDRHEVIFANGVPCETLFLGDLARKTYPHAPWVNAKMTRAYPLAKNAWVAQNLAPRARSRSDAVQA